MKLYFEKESLQRLAEKHKEEYSKASPYPHIWIDNFMDPAALDKVLEEFPTPETKIWKEYENFFEGKLEAQGEEKLSDFTSQLLYQFNSAPFLVFLEKLTGIENLLPDPYFFGGGLHQMKRGGKLGVHADFNKHGKLPLHRRLNAIVYLNKDWKKEYNGDFEIWDRDMKECHNKIQPLFNRLVVFDVTDFNYHGVPEPLMCPEGMTRKSIALFYFTVTRPEGQVQEGKNSTLFKARPQDAVPDGTHFDRDTYDGVKVNKNFKWYIGQVVPPIIISAIKKITG
ncbi:Proline 4-hydroxylase (includes Rps23 Pro-64 3,4-dihydroxylase Tpa1), contains SM-20 domain [Spirosomataceae bacterium TFI 002]|nr:Proline 4-hydroxylase (includes Rps23 Pro-64 3,4-dihydroxylase Tpa1), contains SM-20 domain [Spirosomataceae bacterium TFI 002]